MITVKRKEIPKIDYQIDTKLADYFEVDLLQYVSETSVSKVYLHSSPIQHINTWVEQSLDTNGKDYDLVDEVGGFLIGKYEQREEGFLVAVDYFFPAEEVISKSPVEIKMGCKVFSELDDFLDLHKDCCLVGWFHTHPGWTPFLSETDLVHFHELLFTENYQVAIVLDSKTPRFDSGIFTRKPNREMTNKKDYSEWLKWKDFLKMEKA